MLDPTRRRALLAVASGVAAVAGCTDNDDPPAIDYPNDEQLVEDYEVRQTRNEDGTVLLTQGKELPAKSNNNLGYYERTSRSVVTSSGRLGELTFGDVPEADQLRTFATATDFDSSSLYLLTRPIDACHELRLQSVTAGREQDDELNLHVGFCQPYRAADIECSTSEIHTVGIAIRLPIAAEEYSGSGQSMSSTCRQTPRGEYFDPHLTPTRGGEDE